MLFRSKHFASIDEQTAAIVADPNDVNKRFARSLDFYLVQDFASVWKRECRNE